MKIVAARFSQQSLIWLILIGGLSFFGALYLTLFGDNLGSPKQAAANVYSESAIGHKAFYETLRKAGVDARVRRRGSTFRWSGPVVLAEPDLSRIDWNEVHRKTAASRALIVLPKWRGEPGELRRDTLTSAELLSEKSVNRIIHLANFSGTVHRSDPGTDMVFRGISERPVLDRPQLMRFYTYRHVQPIIWSSEGVLLARIHKEDEFAERDVWILSDPDLINNHGLIKGDNAAIALFILNQVGGESFADSVMFDESIHGFQAVRNMWRTLLDPPYIVVALLAVIAALIYLWSAAGRFGAPRGEAPALGTGISVLLKNAGEMLRFGDRHGQVLHRYTVSALREVAAGLKAPRGLDDPDLVRWADDVTASRGGAREPYSKLLKTAADMRGAKARDEKRVLAAARRLHQWKREMLDVRRGH